MSTPRGRIVTVALSIGVLALADAPIVAQSKMWEVAGNARGDHMGAALTYVQDFDGDGVVDVLVGATSGYLYEDAGRAYLYSGATMTLLREFIGDATQDFFGSIVADLGDVDGDGLRDFAIAAPKRSVPGQPLGAIFIESGSGSLLRTITSAKSTGQVGLDLSYLEDVDGDGVRDLFYCDQDGSQYTLYVVSGATGATIRTHPGATASFNVALSRAGDFDADGVDDYAFCDGQASGGVQIYSGATGNTLFFVSLVTSVLRPAGDVDQDGHGDLMLAAGNGALPVVSGATGQVLYTIYGGPTLGSAASRTGDFDGDGTTDLVVCRPPNSLDPFDTKIFSGRNGALLASLSSGMSGPGAHSLDATEDLDGDGMSDILAGNGLIAPLGWDTDFGSPGGFAVVSEASLAPLAEVFGTAFASEVGFGLTILGDLDGDGFRELALVEPGGIDDTGKYVVQVISGADGHELFRFSLAGLVGRAGAGEIVRIGDVNGDGVEDLAIQTFASNWLNNSVEIRSGADGSLLGSLVPPAGSTQDIASAVDSSGRPLLAIAAQSPSGVYLFDAGTGTLVTSYTGQGGTRVSCGGDLDQDGILDWVVYDFSSSSLHAFSGTSAATLWTAKFPSGTPIYAVVGTGDLDGDGIADLLVSAGGYVGGWVRVLSGASGSQIFQLTSNAKGFGSSVASLGDVNRDGVDDFAVGAQYANESESGSIFLYSGATRGLLDRIDSDAPWLELGSVFPKLPWHDDMRIDGDPVPDLVSGYSAYDDYRGRIETFRLDDLFLQIVPSTAAAGQFVWLNTRGGPTGAVTGLFVVAVDGALVDSFAAFGAFDSSGTWAIGGTVPAALSGHVVTFRSYAIGFQGNVVDSQDETLTIQ